MYYNFDIDDSIVTLANVAEKELAEEFRKCDEMCMYSSAKVLKAFQEVGVNTADFAEVNGYGYEDIGRDKLEEIYCKIFKCEDALVRPQIISGTHALHLTFSGLLKYGDTLVSITGTPYVSVQSIIGTSGNSRNSLISNGIKYEEIPLVNDDFDIDAIKNRLKESKVKLVEIQRSRGYAHRTSLSIAKIERAIKAIREVDKDVIIMVDNCYGDLVEEKEPTEVGADILVGSLMKNLGGGICKSGAYIVGRKDLVLDVAERYTAPCVGKNLGPNYNEHINYFKGLYLAPRTICSALKTMKFASYMLEKLGYNVSPRYSEHRTDIIQTVDFGSEKLMIDFCKGMQTGLPIDTNDIPAPYDCPGYKDKQISASGSFTTGATIELSADGPIIPPYTIYMQGGLSYEYGKLGIMKALDRLQK